MSNLLLNLNNSRVFYLLGPVSRRNDYYLDRMVIKKPLCRSISSLSKVALSNDKTNATRLLPHCLANKVPPVSLKPIQAATVTTDMNNCGLMKFSKTFKGIKPNSYEPDLWATSMFSQTFINDFPFMQTTQFHNALPVCSCKRRSMDLGSDTIINKLIPGLRSLSISSVLGKIGFEIRR